MENNLTVRKEEAVSTRRSFNAWIDMIYAHVQRAKGYEVNRTSTAKTC